jgi:hypothetical protein
VWKIPQAVAGLLPERLLDACYLHMVARFMHCGYSVEEDKKETL